MSDLTIRYGLRNAVHSLRLQDVVLVGQYCILSVLADSETEIKIQD